MTFLVLGGSGSGKSALAEELACSLWEKRKGPLVYLATMDAADGESLRRVARHRQARAGKGFTTLERPLGPAPGEILPGSVVLLEDLGNLLANHLYAPGGRGTEGALGMLEGLAALEGDLVAVGNSVFSDGDSYSPDTVKYLEGLARLQERCGALAQGVAEVVCGIPVPLKGKEWFR